MGIRFYCPNGHKLNVKDFQAGQKGICPSCGTKMQIPLQSTRPSSQQEESQLQGGAAETPTAAPVAPMPNPVAPPVAIPVAAFASAPTAPAAAGKIGDPLAEAGDVVWYVRPSAGGQFGPATADIMRIWLAEGRVGSDALVWREGWCEWQEAGNVFPQLSAKLTISGLTDIVAKPAAASYSLKLKHRARARNTQALVIGILVLTVFILSGVLLWVLLKP